MQNINETTVNTNFKKYTLLFLQTVVCILIFIAFFALKSINIEYFNIAKDWYKTNLEDSLIVEKDIGESSPQSQENETPDTMQQENLVLNMLEFKPEMTESSKNLSLTFIPPIAHGTITSGFGMRKDPFSKKEIMHNGIDIAAPEDTPILAALEGTVQISQSGPTLGNYIIIEHINGIKTLYAHCKKLFKNVGEFVNSGEQIATMGSSGRSTGIHTHFQINLNGQPQNPNQFFKNTQWI